MINILEKIIDWSKIQKDLILGKYFHTDSLLIYKQEIWNVYMGENVGFEESGKGKFSLRPVCVIKKTGNTFFCVSMTSQGKDNHIFYHKINEKSYAILSQTKHLDVKRFKYKIGKISDKKFLKLKEKLKDFIL